jgi:hypothetical protein
MTQRKKMLKELNCEEMCVIEKKKDSKNINKEIKDLKDKKKCLC